MKFNYWDNTPTFWRRFGDSLLAISAFITGTAIAGGNDILAYVALGFGVIGKFLTNFFAE